MAETIVRATIVGATVEVLLQNLIAFSTEEIGLIGNFSNDLQSLKDSVATIRDFLEDAEMKQVNDKPVQRWLIMLEAVAFSADYVFDQLNYQLLCNNEQRSTLKRKLSFTGSESLTNLPQVITIAQRMARLTGLGIGLVPKFNDVAAEIGSLRSLQTLDIGGSKDCPNYVSFKESLDRCSTVLRSIRHLMLGGMQHWDALPDHLQHLTALLGLAFINFGIEELPEWLENLSSLRTLNLIKCLKLRRLPSKKAMEGLTKLVELHIVNCPSLEHSLLQQTSNDSEWSKISHIPHIKVDGRHKYGEEI